MFLSINDDYRRHRIEAVIGVISLASTFSQLGSVSGSDIISSSCSLPITHYGMYGLSNLNDSVIVMKSSLQLDSSNSLLQAIYVNRKSYDNLSAQLVHILLLLVNENDDIAEYIAGLPGPSYLFAKQIDFIDTFVAEYYKDSLHTKSYYFAKATLALKIQEAYKTFKEKIHLIYEQRMPVGSLAINEGLHELFSIGKTTSAKVLRTAVLPMCSSIEEFDELTAIDQNVFESVEEEDEAILDIKKIIDR